MFGICVGSRAARRAATTRRARGGNAAFDTADWFVLLAFASGRRLRARGEAESMDGYLAGEHRVDGACHHIAAAHGAAAGRQRVVPKNQPAGNVEETAATQENASEETRSGVCKSCEWQTGNSKNFGRKFSAPDRYLSAAAISSVFRPVDAGICGPVPRFHFL